MGSMVICGHIYSNYVRWRRISSSFMVHSQSEYEGEVEFFLWSLLLLNVNIKIRFCMSPFRSYVGFVLANINQPQTCFTCVFSPRQDEYLDRFLSLCHAADQHKIPARIGEANFEAELKKSVTDLVQSKSGPLVRFMPLLLDKLTGLMVRPPVISGQVGKLQV